MAVKNQDKFSLKKDNGSTILMKNGEPSVCPKLPPSLIPDQFNPNAARLVRMPCGAACPFFKKAEVSTKDKPEDFIPMILLECMERTIPLDYTDETNIPTGNHLKIKN